MKLLLAINPSAPMGFYTLAVLPALSIAYTPMRDPQGGYKYSISVAWLIFQVTLCFGEYPPLTKEQLNIRYGKFGR